MDKPIRNIAIIAHVDHGKTTLVDGLLKQSHTFHEKAEELKQELIMDSNELERERGITILAKNTSIEYGGIKINIIDTPGHADFGGEVERTLHMADGCILVVDAKEGPMPQTRFVLQKALQLKLKIIVVINKIDKKDQRAAEALEEVANLFLDLAKSADELEFQTMYAVGRDGKAFDEMPQDPINAQGDLRPLFEKIISFVPAPKNSDEGGLQLLVAALDWDSFKGKYAIGKVHRGIAKAGMAVVCIHPDGTKENGRIEKIFVSKGLGRVEVSEVFAGDIVSLTGFPHARISTTIADTQNPEALPPIAVAEPTLKLTIGPNTSPFVGKDGKKLTSREIGERLNRELEINVSLRVQSLDGGSFLVLGRGELHLSVLIETMRREGFELQVSKPEVIIKEIDGVRMEPIEELVVDVPNEHAGTVTAELQKRRALMQAMAPHSGGMRFSFHIPTKNLLGLRNVLLTKTKGTAVLNSVFLKYAPETPLLETARNGALISAETGVTVAYGLEVAQGRGMTFIGPQTNVYGGMIIGLNSREEDLEINACKEKKLSNVRSSFNDLATQLTPPIIMTLEQSLDFLEDDELLEVTPLNLRLRKRYLTRSLRDKHE